MQDARILAKFLIDRKAVSPPLLASWKEANSRVPAVTRQAQLAQTAPMGDRQLPIGCLGRGLTPDLAPVHSRHGDSAAEGFACNATVGTRRVGFRHDFDRWKSRLSFCLACLFGCARSLYFFSSRRCGSVSGNAASPAWISPRITRGVASSVGADIVPTPLARGGLLVARIYGTREYVPVLEFVIVKQTTNLSFLCCPSSFHEVP